MTDNNTVPKYLQGEYSADYVASELITRLIPESPEIQDPLAEWLKVIRSEAVRCFKENNAVSEYKEFNPEHVHSGIYWFTGIYRDRRFTVLGEWIKTGPATGELTPKTLPPHSGNFMPYILYCAEIFVPPLPEE